MIKHYILEDETHRVKPVDYLAWAEWMTNFEKRRVALDEVGGIRVSTVFLGIDHAFGQGEPILFETLVSSNGDTVEIDTIRYCTYLEALEGHQAQVERLQKACVE